MHEAPLLVQWVHYQFGGGPLLRPTWIVGYALALAAIVLAFTRLRWSGRFISAFLASTWLFTGTLYTLLPFTGSVWSVVLSTAFLTEGILLLVFGVFRDKVGFAIRLNVKSFLAGLAVITSLVIFPLLVSEPGDTFWSRHVTIHAHLLVPLLTAGFFAWSRRSIPWYLVLLPLLWLVFSVVAAVEDIVVCFARAGWYIGPPALLGIVCVAFAALRRRNNGPPA